jgi:tetratricopeptide (TPR) repeat protein
MTTAEDLIDLASADPHAAVKRGREHLESLEDSAHAERSVTLRAMSLGARLGDIDVSVEHARHAALVAAEGGLEDLRLMALLTLSGSLAISGQLDAALAVIDEGIEAASDDHLLARFTFQRGAVLANLGRHREALSAMESVLGIFRRRNDTPSLVLTLNRMGRLSTTIGDLERAEASLIEANDLAIEIGDLTSQPGIVHNLGLLAAYQGDIPLSLERLQASDAMYMEMSGAGAPQHVARCEVLIGVGRFEEAAELAIQIAEWNRKSGDVEHQANALLVAAQANLLLANTESAAALSEEAARLLGDDLASPRSREARRVGLEARFELEGASPRLLEDVGAMAEVLAAEGHLVAASQAALLAGRVALASGNRVEADRFLGRVAGTGQGPVELRLQARLARALQRRASGDGRGASAAARSGLRIIDDYQRALGATDLRMGLDRQGVEFGEIGLGLAIESRRPRQVLEWMERTRARALRHRPVIPEGDDATAPLLSELRQVEAELQRVGPPDDELVRRRRLLQEEITRSDRVRRGSSGRTQRFSVEQLMAELGERSLLEIAEIDDQLFGVLIRSGRARLLHLGDAGAARGELAQVRFAMRRAARLGRPFDPEALVRLDELLLGSVRLDGDVIIVPPPTLMAAPWSALPRLGEATVIVDPSAEVWLSSSTRMVDKGQVVVAGGPGLEHADSEVAEIGRLYGTAKVLASGCKVDDLKAAITGASLAHVACHASFEVANPMFSSLRLGDGHLYVYDIERLSAPPSMVVLSACDSGYSETRPGEELAGLTSALLRMGTRAVVASIGLVPDIPATSALMVDFHRRLIAGKDTASALAEAQKEVGSDPASRIASSSFIHVGA